MHQGQYINENVAMIKLWFHFICEKMRELINFDDHALGFPVPGWILSGQPVIKTEYSHNPYPLT